MRTYQRVKVLCTTLGIWNALIEFIAKYCSYHRTKRRTKVV